MDKQARKEARRAAAENPPSEYVDVDGDADADADADEPAVVEER